MSLIFRIWHILNWLPKLSSVRLRLNQLSSYGLLVLILVLQLLSPFLVCKILLNRVCFLNEIKVLNILMILITWSMILKLRTYLRWSLYHILVIILNIYVLIMMAKCRHELIWPLLYHGTSKTRCFSSRTLR